MVQFLKVTGVILLIYSAVLAIVNIRAAASYGWSFIGFINIIAASTSSFASGIIFLALVILLERAGQR